MSEAGEREYGDYLDDILDATGAVASFIEGMTFESFSRDRKTVFAVVRAIEVIGEAAKHVPADFRRRHPDVPWKDMAAMRDKVAHGYFGVDLAIVWETATRDVPVIRSAIERIAREPREVGR